MKRRTKIIFMAEIAIFSAIGFVLDFLASLYSGFFPFGGSVSLALIAIVVLSYRRGFGAGIVCGLIIGLLDLTDGFYTVADKWYNSLLQIGMDYVFTYMFIGFIGLAKPLLKKFNHVMIISISTFIAGVIKYLFHFLSGVLFWPEFPGQPLLERVGYSLVYNGGYMIPTIIICTVISVLLSVKFKDLYLKTE